MESLPDMDYAEYAKVNGMLESQHITCASEYTDAVIEELCNPSRSQGVRLPWDKADDLIRFRDGEVTIWAGVNGHGKSLVLGQCVAWWLDECPTVIGSFEMKPHKTLLRMAKQAIGVPQPREEELRELADWYKGRAWIYDKGGLSVHPDQAIGVCYYAALELGAKAIVLDSLMKIVANEDDYNGQKLFVDQLCQAAKALNIHVHLVAHMRKGSKEGEAPDKFNVKGTGAVVDLVDNLIIVHRNKNKEAQIERGEEVEAKVPDGTLTVAKQRHGEWEGRIALYFHKQTQQYHGGPGRLAMSLRRDRYTDRVRQSIQKFHER